MYTVFENIINITVWATSDGICTRLFWMPACALRRGLAQSTCKALNLLLRYGLRHCECDWDLHNLLLCSEMSARTWFYFSTRGLTTPTYSCNFVVSFMCWMSLLIFCERCSLNKIRSSLPRTDLYACATCSKVTEPKVECHVCYTYVLYYGYNYLSILCDLNMSPQ
jgi:hypothetical protein